MGEKKRGRRVTQKDVALRAGVTRSMVSYVLTGSDRAVASETRKKILLAIDELGYRANKSAQALLSGEESLARKNIGLILHSPEVFLRPYYAEIISGIYCEAHEAGYHIRFIRFFDELKNPILFNELIHLQEVSALILIAIDLSLKTEADAEIIERMRSRIESLVCVDWQREGISSVRFDRLEAARLAAGFLLDRGYGDCAYVGQFDERTSGFKQAFLERGKSDLSRLEIEGALDGPSGYEAMRRLHERCMNAQVPLPRAVCAGSDEIAAGILRYLHERSFSVPSDVALIGIDNIELGEYTSPPLTTVHVQKRALGERAVRLIVNGEAGNGREAVSVLLPLQIIERASC